MGEKKRKREDKRETEVAEWFLRREREREELTKDRSKQEKDRGAKEREREESQ